MKLGRFLHRSAVTLASILAAAGIANAALTFSTGTGFLPGFRLVDGTDLNVIVTALNNITGGGTAAPVSASTLTVSSTSTHTGAATFASTTTHTGASTFASTVGVTGAITPTGGVAASGGFTAQPEMVAVGNLIPAVSTDFTNSTPVITEVYIGEIFVPANMSVTGAAVFNGSASSGGGNFKLGLANSAGAVVATTASTAGGTNDAYTRAAFTGGPFAITGPATYYILSIYDTATAGFFNAPPVGNFGCAKQTGQVYATGFTTITAPTTFTANLCNIASLY